MIRFLYIYTLQHYMMTRSSKSTALLQSRSTSLTHKALMSFYNVYFVSLSNCLNSFVYTCSSSTPYVSFILLAAAARQQGQHGAIQANGLHAGITREQLKQPKHGMVHEAERQPQTSQNMIRRDKVCYTYSHTTHASMLRDVQQ